MADTKESTGPFVCNWQAKCCEKIKPWQCVRAIPTTIVQTILHTGKNLNAACKKSRGDHAINGKNAPVWHLLTANIKHLLQYLFITPLNWLFLCFFQPHRFSEQFENRSVASPFRLVLERAIPLFLLIFLVALPVQVLLACTYSCTDMSIVTWNMLRSIFLAPLFGVTCGLIVAVIDNIGLGIILSVALCVTGIVIGDASIGAVKGIAVAVTLGLVAGTARGKKWGIFKGVLAAICGGLSLAIASFGGFYYSDNLSISTLSITESIRRGIIVSLVFLVCYTLGYYRIPL